MSEESDVRSALVRAVVQKLKSYHSAGITHVPRRKAGVPSATPAPAAAGPRTSTAAKAPPAPPRPTAPRPAAAPPAPVPAAAAPIAATGRAAELAAIAIRVAACTRCAELVANRTQTVFGVGNPHARLIFLGEAPGADEDRKGEPFVGRAGQLLNDIITKGMKLRREDVYIMNIVKCRPPENRTPLPVEATACREYLEAQLAIIQPQFICCLGACAAQNLLSTDSTIGRLRGRMIDFRDIQVLCTYHPAYVLRNPPAKRQVWDDIQILMAAMGLPIGTA